MTPQTQPVEAPALRRRRLQDLMRAWRGRGPAQRRAARLFAVLVLVALCLDVAALVLGGCLIAAGRKKVAPPAERHIFVPYASDAALWEPLRRWTVQEDGRLKPFDTLCRETVRAVTGREQFEGHDPVAVVASWLFLYDPDHDRGLDIARGMNCDWECYPFILCDHHELRALLYREHRGEEELSAEDLHGRYIEPAALRHSKTLKDLVKQGELKQAQDERAVLTSLEQKAAEVSKRLGLYDRVRSGGQVERQPEHAAGEFGAVALDGVGPTWFPLRAVRDFAVYPGRWEEAMRRRRMECPRLYADADWQQLPADAVRDVTVAAHRLEDAYRSGDADRFGAAMAAFLGVVSGVNGEHQAAVMAHPDLELWFNRALPFRRAWLCGLIAVVLLGIGLGARRPWPGRAGYWGGMAAYVGCLGWSLVGFWCRVVLSGRPPVSNMYESVIWVAFMTAAFGLLLELIYRRGVIALAGALVSTLGLVLADQLPLTLAPNIQPLQAVLRSNYWLVIHVLTIVSSYAAFALAWGVGNLNLGLILFAPGRADLIKRLSQFCYRAIQIGVVLLAAGTLLGGFWAAESWGRFWGWDPKEVWALIALLCYLIPLHARYVGWVKDFGLSLSAVVCFASVVMAWYGVNFVLGAGLHSYGFGGGDDAWVYLGGLVNLALVAHAALRYLPRRLAAAGTA
jgi:ABC-type transport system involved in cytochrome c biogenesis permease subunit